MASIASNLHIVRDKVSQAALKVGRNPEDIQIIAVTKTVDIPQMEEAIAAGITAVGENRVQEITKKYPLLKEKVDWHLIGHLQTNKVKYIIDKVKMIHSLDRFSLVKEISKRAQQQGIVMPVLVQVNVAEEESKFGLKVEEVIPFLKDIVGIKGLKILGLMTMAPFVEDAEEVRYVFRDLRNLAEKITKQAIPGVEMKHLSMGMTNDYEVAVEEGATLIRVGTGIFGQRK
ncbi:MAG TPA: YggS family pyridoxal phosphate-dependent enzyme [Clostridia bacterium]|nr:YggS family pyridoxal phosphate-dependent enzyme [Clostridia bacterium]